MISRKTATSCLTVISIAAGVPLFAGCSADDSGVTAVGTGGSGTGGDVTSGGSVGAGGLVTGTGGSGTGSTASTGGAGTSGGSSNGDPCSTAILCDDFESGNYAASWEVQKDSTPPPALDTSKGANGSTKSLKVTGSSQQSFLALPITEQSFYVRTYVNFSKGTADWGAHGWYIVAADNATSGAGNQMRLGASGNHGHPEVDFNVYGDTCSGEKTQFSDGASDGLQGWGNTTDTVLNFSAGTWYCLEAFFDGTGNAFQLWVDGVEHKGLNVTEKTMCAGWAPTYSYLKIGAGANGAIGDVWYDDVVISKTPVGCK